MAAARSLCHVHWRLGQALLPEHFERQELAADRELQRRFGLLAPAQWGVAQLACRQTPAQRLAHVGGDIERTAELGVSPLRAAAFMRARCRNACWAVSTLSGSPCHAASTGA